MPRPGCFPRLSRRFKILVSGAVPALAARPNARIRAQSRRPRPARFLAVRPVLPVRTGRVCGSPSRTENASLVKSHQWVARPEKTVRMYFAELCPEKCESLSGSTFLLALCPLCTIGRRGTLRDSLLRQDTPPGGGMPSVFATWIGQPVVLQVALGDIRVPLRGKLLKEGGDTLRMGIGENELSRISSESGLGHTERAGGQEETFYTYEELRKICLMTVHQVH